MNKKDLRTLLAVIIVCGTIFLTANTLSSTGIRIESSKQQSGITVTGDGKVFAKPDIVKIQAGVSELGKTTKLAQEKANQKLNKILSVLEKNKVEKKDIQTTQLSFHPEYDWQNKAKILKGQRVRQSLNIKIRNITENSENVTNILDALGEIDGLELNSINFDIEDKTNLFSDARKLALKKAKQKAEEMASFSEVSLLKPLSIKDVSVNYYPPMYGSRNIMEMDSVSMKGGSELPTGQLEVQVNVEVIYGIK